VTNWQLAQGMSLATGRIPAADALRQEKTAAEILRRLGSQPGVILADEVGMGKTFVALAVAAGVVESTKRRRPVVVMVPPAVADKWPNDWRVFRERCLPPDSRIRETSQPVRNGSEFLKLLDDPADRRSHIIFMKHGALRASLSDPFIQLAAVRQAFLRRSSLARQRQAFPRWAQRILNDRWFTPDRTEAFLRTPPSRWLDLCSERPSVSDDPVPDLFVQAVSEVDLSAVREALAQLPLNASGGIDGRLRNVRSRLQEALNQVWSQALAQARFRLPLLILDEAHHVKNPTQLASLFVDPMNGKDGLEGSLYEAFDRMLFLTATPFQLGHEELIRVISRFGAVRMSGSERHQFDTQLTDLRAALDRSQVDAARLDTVWGQLDADHVAQARPGWWEESPATLPEPLRRAADAARTATASFDSAQHALRPWVLRHCRDQRREVIGGAGILPGQPTHNGGTEVPGIEVGSDSAVPFLLAARAEAVVSMLNLRDHSGTRAIFSEGLASSYDAFRHREKDDAAAEDGDLPSEFDWYLKQIERFIPTNEGSVLDSHPKVAATTARVLDLWRSGEKVLVFTFYRATGRALLRSISAAINTEIERIATTGGATLDELQRRARNQLDADSPAAAIVRDRVSSIASECGLDDEDRAQLAEVVLRFLRTPAFQVRFLQSDVALVDGLEAAFGAQNGTGADLLRRITTFAERAARLVPTERQELWDELTGVQTGDIRFGGADDELAMSSATVRLANGDTGSDTRRRLMRTFNSPFFPEVLVASSVMGEGVDLHLDCRHVIHHDLDWNPSVLEQRTGRIDRVGSKSEQVGRPIQVFEPFLAATQDERLYRVVKDRERWFNVIMGGTRSMSQWDVDVIAQRVPLPDDLVERLTLDLGT
jgi:hypothetical protein